MDQTNNNNFYQQVQISRNSNAIWARRDYSVSAETSFGLTSHCMGCHLPSVGTPCQTEENVMGLSLLKAKTPGQNNHEDGEELEISSKCDKHHVFNSKKESHEKKMKNKKRKTQTKKKAITDKKDCKTVHVQDVSLQWKTTSSKYDIQQQQAGSKFESKKHTSVAVVSFKHCPNKRRIREVAIPLGELCRVGFFKGTMWITEEPTMPCHLVLPNNFHKQNFENQVSVHKVSEVNSLHESSHAHNSSSMLVEKIKNECDRLRIATSVMLNLLKKGSELTELELNDSEFTQYLEGIKEFGFNHIIIVGERDYGLLFLDCYGRMFNWDAINVMLWPLGNYLENKPMRVAWAVELNGTITQFEIDENLSIVQ